MGYGEGLWWAGMRWNVNQYAVSKSMHSVPADQVRFYRKSDARRVEEFGVVRYEWQSQSGLGELDLAMGDPSATVLNFNGPFPPSLRQSMRFHFDFQYVVLEGSCNFTALGREDQSGSSGRMEPGDMFWVRAGVAHRIEAVAGNTLKVMVVGGKWKPQFVEYEQDRVYNYYEDMNVQGSSSIPKGTNNSWFRSYKLQDQQWTPNPTLPDSLQNKMWERSRDNNDDVAYLSVKWTPYQWLPRHTHATGAFYIIMEGMMHFPGEGGIGKFEARWTAPGHFYAGERSMADGALIVVLGTDSPPQFVDLPPEGQRFSNYLGEKRRNMHHVFDDPATVAMPFLQSASSTQVQIVI